MVGTHIKQPVIANVTTWDSAFFLWLVAVVGVWPQGGATSDTSEAFDEVAFQRKRRQIRRSIGGQKCSI